MFTYTLLILSTLVPAALNQSKWTKLKCFVIDLYFSVGLHLNPPIFQRGVQLVARKLLQARLQRVYSDTAITQKLPSILRLKICCPHRIHFAHDDFTVFFIWTQLGPGLRWWYTTTFLYQGWTTRRQLLRPCQGNEQRSAVTSLRPALSLRTGICGIESLFPAVQDITFISRTSYYGN